MFSIGNDIVDLRTNEEQHERYISRVISDEEKNQFSETDLWEYWAVKEASYKAIKRIDPKTLFVPRKFIYDKKNQKVYFENFQLDCSIKKNTEYVHALSEINYGNNHYRLFVWIDKIKPYVSKLKSESIQIRQMCKEKIASLLCIHSADIEITSGGQKKSKIPQILIYNQKTEHVISLSHHGNYMAAYFSMNIF